MGNYHYISTSKANDKNFQMKSVILLNKSDMEQKVTEEIVKKEYFASIPAKYKNEIEEKNQKIPEIIGISAKNRQGIQTLEETLKKMFFEGNLSFNDEIYITNVRQKAALQDAKEALLQVLESIRNGMPEDFYSIDLMAAYEALGSITGETIGEDLVNEIFSKFCMGK